MLRLLWEDVTLEDLEFHGTREKNEIECNLREEVGKNIKNILSDEELIEANIGDDFSVLDECDTELNTFSEDDFPHIVFPFAVLLRNKAIRTLEDIKQEYLENLVSKIENAVIKAIDSVLKQEDCLTRFCFIKAYIEED